MTLVLGLRCRDGVVLAADSQRTEDSFREEIPKLFVTRSASSGAPQGASPCSRSCVGRSMRSTSRDSRAGAFLLRLIDGGRTEPMHSFAAVGVGPPVQVAVVAGARAEVLPAAEMPGLTDTVAAFREHQRTFLVRDEPEEPRADTGLRPS